MRKWTLLIAMCCSLVPAVVSAQAEIDCKSAKRPNVDIKTYLDTCNARAATERAGSRGATLAAAALTVSQSRTTVAGLSFASVPTWSNADILAQFPLTRDKRYMATASNPTIQRRISWMYPDDGCFSRAEQVNVQAAQAGKVKPYKLFALGNLRVYTENHPAGEVFWGWHVVPVVKNSAGEPIVFDAALSPCRPLPWKEWLALMASDIAQFDNVAGGWGVALGDANAYYPFSLVSGEPSHAAESLTQQTQQYLVYEWDRQVALGRSPNVVLGSNPPWGGYACVNATETPAAFATVAPGATRTLTATCPFGTLATGGGISAPRGFLVTRNSKSSGNGWTITARNNTSANAELDVRAVCLTGAPGTAAVTTVTGSTTNVSANNTGTSSASCGSGTLIGGGYLTTGTTSIMRVYSNKRSTSTSSTWQVSAQNTTTSSKSITAYAYCLPNTRFTFNQVTGTGIYDGGYSIPTCSSPKKVMGGGYAFPRTSNYHVDFTAIFGPERYLVSMDGTPANPDPNALGHAECLTHP
jgi:hypothetical protein